MNHIILSPSTRSLFLLKETTGQLQRFDLSEGLLISLVDGQLSIDALPGFTPEAVRSLTFDLHSAIFNICFDAQAQVLSIVLTPHLPSSDSIAARGGKMKLGSVDLTLTRNTLTADTANIGATESTNSAEVVHSASTLEWYLLNLKQFNLALRLENDNLVLSSFALDNSPQS